MTGEKLTERILEICDSTPGRTFRNVVLFDAPVVGFATADDSLFDEYKKDGVIGPWFMKPDEWLEGAATVISVFFPISEEVRRSNRSEREIGSREWTYARIEGQEYIASAARSIVSYLESEGYPSVYPSGDGRFRKIVAGSPSGKMPEEYGSMDGGTFSSNWSERHAAYAAGLGTFGLSKGLITRKGIAGRFAGIITTLEIEPDERKYSGIYDYCINCGKCAARCPAGAIDLISGKDHAKCAARVKKSGVIRYPRYGCGLCQTDVPCENGIPLMPSEKKLD